MRRLVFLAALLATLAIPVALPSAARADEPVRSGTILGGSGSDTPASPWIWGMEGCVGAPACFAWLQAGCNPALAGLDPALHSSITDVGELADTERILEIRHELGVNWGMVVVQFWTETPVVRSVNRCSEILNSRIQSDRGFPGCRCEFRMPRDAKWMTITSSPDNTNLSWTLR